MKVFYGIKKIKKYPKPVVALGVFDGVHLGHSRILKSAVSKAKAINGTSMVLTFWPHPQREESLYSLTHRLKLIERLGVDVAVVINFNKVFSRLSSEEFMGKILADKVHAQAIYVGRNFKFGRNAEGNVFTLQKASGIYHFKVLVFNVQKAGARAISSTSIRELIKKGNLKKAQKLLTRPVSILGTVIRGVSLGRKLGYPTANIDPHHEVIPPEGVYAVSIILGRKKFKGACYIGPRPSFPGQAERAKRPKAVKNIEVYIFNFHRNIYGKNMEILFLKKLRGRRRFSSPAALTLQIEKDILKVRKSLLNF